MARVRFPAWEFFSRRSKFFLKTSATGHDNQRIQSTQHPHPLDDVIHWLINEQVGRINNKNHWKLLVCSASLRHGSENWILPPAYTLQARCVCVDYSWILRDDFECLLIKIQNYRNLFIFGIILLFFFVTLMALFKSYFLLLSSFLIA